VIDGGEGRVAALPLFCKHAPMIAGFAALLLVSALPQPPTGDGRWELFQTVSSGGQQYDYYYDRPGVTTSDEKVAVTIRILGMPAKSVTLSSIELNCRTVTFTETKTVSTDGAGHMTELAPADLWRDAPILPGKSADKLRRLLCR
jgi:hypothetical protein